MNNISILLSVFSLLLFLYGSYSIIHRQKSLLTYFLYSLCFIFFIIYSNFYYVSYYFTGVGIDESVIFHLKYGLEGAGFLEYKFLLFSVIFILILSIIFLIYYFKIFFSSNKIKNVNIIIPITFFVLSGLLHPATIDLLKLSKKPTDKSFWKFYKQPRIYDTPKIKKNFVFIYTESLERTYFDNDTFPDLIMGLRKIESQNISFTNIISVPNTRWTIAGMVASQCGVPLVALSHGNSMAGMDEFMSGAVCMGDLLSKQGYHLTYMNGASLEFAGKGKFYNNHGFDEVLGRNELSPLLSDQTYQSDWGLYDDSLFKIAFDKYLELSNHDQPFGLFLLTLDTHGAGNHSSATCKSINYKKGANETLNAVSCSEQLTSNFVKRIQSSPAGKDTVIVIASDHLAMRNMATHNLEYEDRKNLFIISDPTSEQNELINKEGSTLDIGATVLGALGYKSHLGLGRNLLANEVSVVQEIPNIDSLWGRWQNEILKLWSFPQIKNHVTISKEKMLLAIDDREFMTPILVTFDENLQTEMRFQIYNSKIHKTLTQHLAKFSESDSFLLIDACKHLQVFDNGLKPGGLCYTVGKLGTDLTTGNIENDITITADQLLEITNLPIINKDIYQSRVDILLTKMNSN